MALFLLPFEHATERHRSASPSERHTPRPINGRFAPLRRGAESARETIAGAKAIRGGRRRGRRSEQEEGGLCGSRVAFSWRPMDEVDIK